jgi:hypothetical protein
VHECDEGGVKCLASLSLAGGGEAKWDWGLI